MSHTYDIACKDCKQNLWIGQGWNEKDFKIYTGKNDCMDKLKNFLFAHMGHRLVFDNS